MGRPCPLPFFFGSFESSVVSLVGFLFGQPVERGHYLLPVQVLPSLRGIGLDPVSMGCFGGLFEIGRGWRGRHEQGLAQISPAAGGPVPRLGEAGSLHTHHRLGWASASPRPSPFLLGTGCRMPLNLFPCKACCHTYLGMEGGIVEMTHGSSLGPEGVGCEGAVGP